jgi:2-polyprenyl-3-methyl-5-hydroxy-6-metoxy-1,4-benzoquinol methylase
VDTLEHLEEPEKVVNNLLDALTPTGFLCIVVPNGRYDTFEGHIHYWSPESLILFMKKIKCNISHKHVWNKYGEQCVIIQK